MFGPHPRSYEQRLPRKMKRTRAPRRADRQARRRGDPRHRHLRARGRSRPQDVAGVLSRAQRDRAASWSSRRGRDEKLRLSARNLPTVVVDPRRLAQRRRHPQRRHARHRAAGARAGWKRSTCERADRARDHPAPGREREVDRPVARTASYTFRVHPDANKIQIKAAIEELYAADKVTVVAVNVLTTKAKEKSRGTTPRPDQGLHLAVAQGRRDPGRRPEDPVLRGRLRCRCVATSPPRPACAG